MSSSTSRFPRSVFSDRGMSSRRSAAHALLLYSAEICCASSGGKITVVSSKVGRNWTLCGRRYPGLTPIRKRQSMNAIHWLPVGFFKGGKLILGCLIGGCSPVQMYLHIRIPSLETSFKVNACKYSRTWLTWNNSTLLRADL